MIKELDGPRLEPRGRAPSALVVLLHGYGANGDDLIALGEEWRRRLPAAAFVAPNAPQMIPGMPGALQWFALTMRDPGEYWRGVVAAAPASRPVPRCGARPLPACRRSSCARGLQPGHHDGPARRIAACRWAGCDRRLLRSPCRAGASRRDHRAPADPAHPRRDGRPDSGRRAAHRARAAGARGRCWSNGTCAPASATASIRAD